MLQLRQKAWMVRIRRARVWALQGASSKEEQQQEHLVTVLLMGLGAASFVHAVKAAGPVFTAALNAAGPVFVAALILGAISPVLEDLNTRSRSLVWLQNCKVLASKFVYRLTAAAVSMPGPVQDSFRCPITQDVMVDPVIVTETGHTYERSAIEQWLRTHNTDPKTNVRLMSKKLIPNHSLRASIQEFAANNGAGLSP